MTYLPEFYLELLFWVRDYYTSVVFREEKRRSCILVYAVLVIIDACIHSSHTDI